MEKIPIPPQESNYSSQTNDTNKIEEEKISQKSKESQIKNIINISSKNDNLYKINNTNNNIYSNTESLYPLLFT